MPNGTYGGVGGRKTKVGQKTYSVFRPTRLQWWCIFNPQVSNRLQADISLASVDGPEAGGDGASGEHRTNQCPIAMRSGRCKWSRYKVERLCPCPGRSLGRMAKMWIHSMYHEGVTIAVRSQKKPWFLRNVCLWGRAESGSAKVNELLLSGKTFAKKIN